MIGDILNDCLVSVDGVDFCIEEPYPYEKGWSRRWYTSKFGGPGLRYEIAICILSGEIVWINGPFPPGMYNDYKIFMECGLKNMLEKNERVEADDGYLGADPAYAKAKSAPWHPESSLVIRNNVRACHETVNNRMKFFAALRNVFKNGVEKHQDVVLAVAVLVQLCIQMGEPLFLVADYNDLNFR